MYFRVSAVCCKITYLMTNQSLFFQISIAINAALKYTTSQCMTSNQYTIQVLFSHRCQYANKNIPEKKSKSAAIFFRYSIILNYRLIRVSSWIVTRLFKTQSKIFHLYISDEDRIVICYIFLFKFKRDHFWRTNQYFKIM